MAHTTTAKKLLYFAFKINSLGTVHIPSSSAVPSYAQTSNSQCIPAQKNTTNKNFDVVYMSPQPLRIDSDAFTPK